MEVIRSALDWYAQLPASVMIMLGIFVVAFALARLTLFKSLRSSVYVAAGMIGMGTMIGMFLGQVAPIMTKVIENTGLKLDVIDAGVGTQTSVMFALSFYALLLPVGLAVNVVMLLLKWTSTFNVDIWNYNVMAMTSSFVLVITENIALAILGFAITMVIILKLADFTAPAIQKAYGIEGISIPHASSVIFAPVAIAVNWVIEKIPGVRDIDWSPEVIETQTRGVIQPWTIGLVLGVVLGIVGGASFGEVLLIGTTTAAFMILFPKVLGLLVEGIQPVADGMRERSGKLLKREVNIGLDAAILVGTPSVMVTGMLLVPVILLLAFTLPGNRVMPFADLAIAGPFLMTCCMPYLKMNIFRGLICGTVVFTLVLYTATATVGWYNAAAAMNGLPFDTEVTSMGIASSWVSWLLATITELGTSLVG